jgi:prefoldin subunit 5
MNAEVIKARIELLTAQAKQMEQTLQAISGAIQDCQYWLTQLDQTNAASKTDSAQNNGEG